MVIRHQYPLQDYPWLLQVNYRKPHARFGDNPDIRFVNVTNTPYDYISFGKIVAIFKCKPKLKLHDKK